MGNVASCFGLLQAPLQILWLKSLERVGWGSGCAAIIIMQHCKAGSLRGVNYGELAMLKCCKCKRIRSTNIISISIFIVTVVTDFKREAVKREI